MTESRAGFSPAQLTVAVTLGAYAAGLSVLPARYLALGCLPLLAAALAWWTLARPGRWVAAFLSAALLLPPMPFAMGNSGPHPALIFAGLGLVAAAIAASSREIPLDGLTPALAALFLVLLGSVGFAALYSGPAIAVATLARVLLLAICLLMYFYNVRLHDRAISLRALYAVAVVSALMACVDFYYQFPAPTGFGAQFVWLASGVYRRAQGVFYEASTLGNLCAFFLVMIAVALSRPAREVPLPRRALFAGGVVFSAALLFSYSRASVLNVVVALVALLYLRRAQVRLRRAVMFLLLAAAAGAAVTYAVFPEFTSVYWQRFSTSGIYFFTYTEGILSGRVQSWRFIARFLMDHPWHLAFGVGYKTLPYSDFLGRTVIADNMYLSMLMETGVAGLGTLLWFNMAILRAAYRAACNPNIHAAFYGAWIFCFWCGQTVQMLSADLLTYWRVLPVYFLVLAWAVRESQQAAA